MMIVVLVRGGLGAGREGDEEDEADEREEAGH